MRFREKISRIENDHEVIEPMGKEMPEFLTARQVGAKVASYHFGFDSMVFKTGKELDCVVPENSITYALPPMPHEGKTFQRRLAMEDSV